MKSEIVLVYNAWSLLIWGWGLLSFYHFVFQTFFFKPYIARISMNVFTFDTKIFRYIVIIIHDLVRLRFNLMND